MDLNQSDIARKGLLALKNAIFHFILKEREERKVPKLKDILNKAIEQQKRSKQAMRNKIASLSLDNLEATDTYLTEELYLQVQEKYDKIKVSMTSF